MSAAALRLALGPPAAAPALRRAFADHEGFWPPTAGGAGGETVSAFAAARAAAARPPDASRDVAHVVVLGGPGTNPGTSSGTSTVGALAEFAAQAVAAFFCPLRVTVGVTPRALSELGRLRLFMRAGGGLDTAKVREALERDAALAQAAVVIAVAAAPAGAPAQLDHHGRVVVLQAAAPSHSLFRLLCRAVWAAWLQARPCPELLRCPSRSGGGGGGSGGDDDDSPQDICPVCLRKLSLAAVERFDPVARYEALFTLALANAWPDARWLADRLAFLGRTAALDRLEAVAGGSASTLSLPAAQPRQEPPQPMPQQQQPQQEQVQQQLQQRQAAKEAAAMDEMRTQLATLKARIKPAKNHNSTTG
jgi:hypothetical protein